MGSVQWCGCLPVIEAGYPPLYFPSAHAPHHLLPARAQTPHIHLCARAPALPSPPRPAFPTFFFSAPDNHLHPNLTNTQPLCARATCPLPVQIEEVTCPFHLRSALPPSPTHTSPASSPMTFHASCATSTSAATSSPSPTPSASPLAKSTCGPRGLKSRCASTSHPPPRSQSNQASQCYHPSQSHKRSKSHYPSQHRHQLLPPRQHPRPHSAIARSTCSTLFTCGRPATTSNSIAITSIRTPVRGHAFARCRCCATPRSRSRFSCVIAASGEVALLRAGASTRRTRDFTSITACSAPPGASAMMSASPLGVRALRCRIVHPFSRSIRHAASSPSRPM